MSDQVQQILPFYCVCDESGSMSGEKIESLNKALLEVHEGVVQTPVVADKAHFGIIGFSDSASVLLPLSDLRQVTQMPVLRADSGTNAAAAFRCLRDEIDSDVKRLKAAGHKGYRPAAFFFTDGQFNPGWESDWTILTDPKNDLHPNILAFGIGADADPGVISHVATLKAFMDDGTMSPGAAIREFAMALLKSVLMSGQKDQLVIPNAVPGFTSLPMEQI